MAKRKTNTTEEKLPAAGPVMGPPELVRPADIDPRQIDPSPFQVRRDFPAEDIRDLAESMARLGMLQAIAVRPKGDRFELLEGERRLRAAKLLKLPTVRAEVQDRTDSEARAIVIESSLRRKELNAIEEAAAFRAMLDAGDAAGPTELARLLGVSQGHVSNRLGLLKLPEPVQARIISQEIPPTHARCLVPLAEHPQLIATALDRFAGEGGKNYAAYTVAEFSEEFDYQIDDATAPMSRVDRYDARLKQAKSVFEPTADEAARLGLIEVTNGRGEAETRATNVKLWEKLQTAHLEALARVKEKPAGKNGRPAANSKQLTPAQRKAAAAAEKERAKLQAKQFKRRLYEFKIDWLRYLIAGELTDSDPATLIRVLVYLAGEPGLYGQAGGDRRRRIVTECATRPNPLPALVALGNSDHVDAVARRFAASCFWYADEPNREIPEWDIESLADFLCINQAAFWGDAQAGPLSACYWELHTKDQLINLAAELKFEDLPSGSKSKMVAALVASNKRLPLPKELANAKRPK